MSRTLARTLAVACPLLLSFGHVAAQSTTVLPRISPPVDGADLSSNEYRYADFFETDPLSTQLAAGAHLTTTGGEVLEAARSVKLPPGGSLTLDPAALAIGPLETCRLIFQFRIFTAAPTGSSLLAEAVWDGGSADLGALTDVVSGPEGNQTLIFRFGAVNQPTFRVTATAGATVVVDSVIVQERLVSTRAAGIHPVTAGYPRLAKVGWESVPAMSDRAGQKLGPFLELLSRFHHVTGFEGDPTIGNEWASSIRDFSPDILLTPSWDAFASEQGSSSPGGARIFQRSSTRPFRRSGRCLRPRDRLFPRWGIRARGC
ncbi:MAG: hypothetical protein O3A87_00060 [Verrucomicrobia bacterium]|nr:hypothetical protein [Verrucomicrobiota bacterium]